MGVKKNYVKGPSPRNRRKLDKNIRTQVTGSSVKKVNQFFFWSDSLDGSGTM